MQVECHHCHTVFEDNDTELCPVCKRHKDDDSGFYNPLTPKPGELGLDVTGGGAAIGLGGGLSMDMDDGGLNIGGIGLDGD